MLLSNSPPWSSNSRLLGPVTGFAGLLALSLAGGCIGVVGSGADVDPCTPGELGCVCERDRSCETGLTCIADRCIELESTSTPRGELESSPAEPDSSSAARNTTKGGRNEDPSTSARQEETSDVTSSQDEEASTSDSEATACADQTRNNRETDIDCGGPVCMGCALDQTCRGDIDCLSGACVDERCVECARDAQCDDQNPCTQDRCSAERCEHTPLKDGERCDDQDPCTAKDRCSAGACKGKSTLVLNEDFDHGTNGWRFLRGGGARHTFWEIGTASASNCANKDAGQDPAQDHTQQGINGVAGVKIGGCHDRRADGVWDCMWSKDLDTSFFDEPVVFSFWRHLHSPAGDANRGSGVPSRVVYRYNKGNKSYPLDEGYPSITNDGAWVFKPYDVDLRKPKTIAFGICYRNHDRTPSFAGWTVDDAKVRQKGCLPDE